MAKTEEQQKNLQIELARAARSPEAKLLMEHLMEQGKAVLFNQDPLIYKGWMLAYYVLKDLQEK